MCVPCGVVVGYLVWRVCFVWLEVLVTKMALNRVARTLRTAADDRCAGSDQELLERFRSGDREAFAALVRRHGRGVLAACRQVLSDVDDVDDVFQATFLVMLKRVHGLDGATVGGWLFTVAHRLAVRARCAARHRADCEATAARHRAASEVALPDPSWREAVAILHEELDQLPDRYRRVLLLCYLDGLSREEAAAALGWEPGAVKGCLERGRKRLAGRLARRGIGLPVGLLAVGVGNASRASSVRPELIELTLRLASGPPPAVAALAGGMMMTTRGVLKPLVVVVLVAGAVALGLGTGWADPAPRAVPDKMPVRAGGGGGQKDRPPVTPVPAEGKDAPVVGRVLGTDGKPLAGADLLLVGKGEPKKLGVSGPDGRFAVTAPRGERWVNLVARAAGAGIDFIDLGSIAPTAEVELRLVNDHPIRGQVVDTQGKPVAGASVQVRHVGVYRGNSVDPFLAEWKARSPHDGLPSGTKHLSDGGHLFQRVTTDKDGRFAVTGAGAERLVELRVSGVGVAAEQVWVVNRDGFDPKPYNQATDKGVAPFGLELARWLLHGPELSLIAQAEKPIRGVMRDKDTGKPRPGVLVSLSRYGNDLAPIILTGTTDAEGRYEIRGARKAKAYMVEVASDTATGHMAAQFRAEDTAGYAPIIIDLAVKKGVIVTGRVIDKGTGKPVPARVLADALHANPHVKDYPEYESSAVLLPAQTGSDGTFRVVAFPGPVLLMASPDVNGPDGMLAWFKYKQLAVDPKYPKYFPPSPNNTGGLRRYYGPDGAERILHGITCKVIEIKPGTETVEQDLVVEPASALTVKIRDAGGKPVTSAWVTGMSAEDWHHPVEVKGDTSAAYHLDGKPRLMAFYEPTKKLFGTLALKGNEKEAVSVTLGPGGAVTGRLVDEDDKPLAGVLVQLDYRDRTAAAVHTHVHRSVLTETDADGKFRVDDAVPGMKFGMTFRRGKRSFDPSANLEDRTAEPGKATELGELKLKPIPERVGE